MKNYIRLDPITERKLIGEIDKLHYSIPEDDFINVRNIIFSCVKNHMISIPQIHQIICLLSEKKTRTIFNVRSLRGKYKAKKTERIQLFHKMISYNEKKLWLIEFDRKNEMCKLLFALLFINFNQQSESKGFIKFNR
ncbi:hypothetical protein [Ruminococcus sp. zg-924]|uniref:hypothetical protein n=1 Tax=Ruminococcus sp. zg-924 TaxID=2678505 RepID=UPI002108608C|nr:hypothetical protein [Ruminococcus sp. zg-924]MCQ4022835.1 hypothetical protein [Ruminococcus sp. zg-924]